MSLGVLSRRDCCAGPLYIHPIAKPSLYDGGFSVPSMGAHLKVQEQLHEGDRVWEASVERKS